MAIGVRAWSSGILETLRADAVVLAAGGIGTSQVLRSSGIGPSDNLWAYLALTVGGRTRDARQLEEPPMVWTARGGTGT
jgi:choline dehydrogenase-like flavoprotein